MLLTAFEVGLVFSYTDNAESIFDYSPWYINQKGKWVEYKVESWKRHNKGMVAKLEGMDVREDRAFND
ncbi:16S rRNA processing protein RimM [Vibrio parahaemolyticus AQ4037]|nr:16S rRNA processing protein RimM [Vibrio parahaemolyticus AQ4037]